jgi:hypothetical protein
MKLPVRARLQQMESMPVERLLRRKELKERTVKEKVGKGTMNKALDNKLTH